MLFLFAGADALRELIAACDERFKQARSELIAIDDDATLAVQANAWMRQSKLFDAALTEAGNLLPAGFKGPYEATAWPQKFEVGARSALRGTIFNLTHKRISFS